MIRDNDRSSGWLTDCRLQSSAILAHTATNEHFLSAQEQAIIYIRTSLQVNKS